MRRLIRKEIFYLLIIDIVLYLLLPLEVYGIESRYIVYPLIWVSIFVIGINLLPRKKSIGKLVLLIIGTLFYLLITCVFAFVFFLFCRWANHGELYKSKKHDSLRIICKTYDCYGTAEPCRLFKQRELFKRIYWITQFNENKVDTAVWEKIP